MFSSEDITKLSRQRTKVRAVIVANDASNSGNNGAGQSSDDTGDL